jgi:hypothetical protein
MSPLRSRLQFPPATLSLPSASRSFSRTAVVRARAAPDSSSSSSSSSDLSPAENARKRQSDSPLRRGNLGGAQVKEPNFRKWRDTKALQWKNTKRNETNWLGRETVYIGFCSMLALRVLTSFRSALPAKPLIPTAPTTS